METCILLEREMLINPVDLSIQDEALDFDQAKASADRKAREISEDAMLVAWYDRQAGKFSPPVECGGKIAEIVAQLDQSYLVGAILGYLEVSPEDAARAGLDLDEPTEQAETTTSEPADEEAEDPHAGVHFKVDETQVIETNGGPGVKPTVGLPVPANVTGATYLSPRMKARNMSIVCRPGFGLMVPGGTPQISSALARCSGFVTTMSAGSRCASVPTSRTVPQAEGCPVSENGPFPGSEIFPVRRWTL